jgi:hypothetical protein
MEGFKPATRTAGKDSSGFNYDKRRRDNGVKGYNHMVHGEKLMALRKRFTVHSSPFTC